MVRSTKTLTWENLNYHVPTPSGPLRLLHDINGYVKPGTLTALMGASGAGMSLFRVFWRWTKAWPGKTTGLDVLAQRKNIGIVSGDILIDGRPLDSNFARGTAYGMMAFGFVIRLSYIIRFSRANGRS
jgi:ATP-binding cassette, subfamily G (WHITE), member 2, SNQ2